MGFLNPWLYSRGEDFLTDVTQGHARGCDGTNHQSGKKDKGAVIIPWATWNATAGWDPATGLGIPDFGKMVQVAVTDVIDAARNPPPPSPYEGAYGGPYGNPYLVAYEQDE
jgi:hypothetical protein